MDMENIRDMAALAQEDFGERLSRIEVDEKPDDNRITTSQTIGELAGALAQFQAEVHDPKADTYNPIHKSYYATLADFLKVLRPILGKYGLAVIQNPWNSYRAVPVEEGRDDPTRQKDMIVAHCQTLLVHKSGEWMQSGIMKAGGYQRLKGGVLRDYNIQGLGSAITYLRRYQLGAMLGLASTEEDDDGSVQGQGGGEEKEKAESSDCIRVLNRLVEITGDIVKAKAMIRKNYGVEYDRMTEQMVAHLDEEISKELSRRAAKAKEAKKKEKDEDLEGTPFADDDF